MTLKDIFRVIWNGKYFVAISVMLGLIISIFVSLILPNIYLAQTKLVPTEDSLNAGLSAITSQYGGLASLAGISLPSSKVNKTTIAIETLKSRKFVLNFINKYDILVPLFATKSWDPLSKELSIDALVYDLRSDEWVRDVPPSKKSKPSDWETYEAFMKILNINSEGKNGIIIIGIEHISPVLATKWVNDFVKEGNRYIKNKEVLEALNSIEYLKNQLANTAVVEMQKVFYQLIEEQSKTIMLANVREEYVFSTIDPAVIPEEKVSPRRSLLVIASTMFMFFLSTFIILLRYSIRYSG